MCEINSISLSSIPEIIFASIVLLSNYLTVVLVSSHNLAESKFCSYIIRDPNFNLAR